MHRKADGRDHSESEIRPGFFKIQLGKKTPWLPAVIYRPCPIEMPVDGEWFWHDRWPALQAMCDTTGLGALREVIDPYKVWVGGTEIDIDDFWWRMETRQHIRLHEPDAADADPRQAVDVGKMAPIKPRSRP